MKAGKRYTDEELSAGQFEFDRMRTSYPCEAHAEWLKRLDDRLWTVIVVTCGGALASLITLIISLAHAK